MAFSGPVERHRDGGEEARVSDAEMEASAEHLFGVFPPVELQTAWWLR